MIELKTKQDVLIKYFREGMTQRAIAREVGIDRKTVKRYIEEYEDKLLEIEHSKGEVDKGELIQSLVESPKYDTSSRVKRKLTEEIENKIRGFLEENKIKRQGGLHKQTKKIIDIHDALELEGYDISYTTVRNTVRNLARKEKEAFIRGSYHPGHTCEFDWGEVKITIAGVYQMLVYDNMKVAVKQFVGTEKEPTEGLLKLSSYYLFQFRFCNAAKGNEKGHVEKSVEVVRRKAFAFRDTFETLEEANHYLLGVCHKLNQKTIKKETNQTAEQLLQEEKGYLLPTRPPFDAARIVYPRVDKYSTVMVDQNRYSVQDHLVGEVLKVKIYSNRILCFYQEEKVADHHRLTGSHEWSLKLEHYVKTLKKKPGALADSAALQQASQKIKTIYKTYYTSSPKEFVELIAFMRDGANLSVIEQCIEELRKMNPQHVTTDKIKVLYEKHRNLLLSQPEPVHTTEETHAIEHHAQENLKMYDTLFQTGALGTKEATA